MGPGNTVFWTRKSYGPSKQIAYLRKLLIDKKHFDSHVKNKELHTAPLDTATIEPTEVNCPKNSVCKGSSKNPKNGFWLSLEKQPLFRTYQSTRTKLGIQ